MPIDLAACAPTLEQPKKEGIGLALGGGFARGFAHIGVLKVLEEERIPIAVIGGTSVGSVIGGAYASGASLERITEVCRKLRFKDIAKLQISKRGLASNERLGELVRRCFAAMSFEGLKIPMRVVATDLGTGEPYVFESGDLTTAIRASCAYPGLFEPVMHEGRCLADGGLVATVPTDAVRAAGARPVVAVSVGFNNWNGGAPTNMMQVLSRAVSAAQKHAGPTWERAADVMIEPVVHQIEWDEFGRTDEAVAAGIAAARKALPAIRRAMAADYAVWVNQAPL